MFRENLRILCISPLFPPLADSEAFCSGKMVLALKNAGVDIIVLCEPPLLGRGIDNSFCWNSLSGLRNEIQTPLTWDEIRIWERIEAIYYGIRFKTLRVGRVINRYIISARWLHEIKPFNVVYSRSFPIYAHYIGYWCSKLFKVPWVANINDPWDIWDPRIETDKKIINRGKPYWYIQLSRYWLKRALKRAEVVTYPCKNLYEFQMRESGVNHYGEVIPHIGWQRKSENVSEGKFILIHAGKLGIERRSPETILKGFARFLSRNTNAKENARLLFIGNRDSNIVQESKKLDIEFAVEDIGPLNYEDSLKYINSASVCVLIEAKMKEGIYFPSKLADYIVAQKPILALSPASGFIASFDTQSGIRRVNPDDDAKIAEAINDFYQAFLKGELRRFSPPKTLVEQLSPYAIAQRFLDIVNSILQI